MGLYERFKTRANATYSDIMKAKEAYEKFQKEHPNEPMPKNIEKMKNKLPAVNMTEYDSKTEQLVDASFSVELTVEDVKKVMDATFGAGNYTMRENPQEYLAKAKKVTKDAALYSSRSFQMHESLGDIDEPFFNVFAELLDYRGADYKNNPENKKLIALYNEKTSQSKAKIVDEIIKKANSIDFEKYKTMSDEELMADYPSCIYELSVLQNASDLYLTGVKQGLYPGNSELIEHLNQLKAEASLIQSNVDMRMDMCTAQLNAFVKYEEFMDRKEMNFNHETVENLVGLAKISPFKDMKDKHFNFVSDVQSAQGYDEQTRMMLMGMLAKNGLNPKDNVTYIFHDGKDYRKVENFNDICKMVANKMNSQEDGNRIEETLYFKKPGEEVFKEATLKPATTAQAMSFDTENVSEGNIESIQRLDSHICNKSEIAELYNELSAQDSKRFALSNSEEFKNVLGEMVGIYNHVANKDVTPEDLQEANEGLLRLQTKCQDYLVKKEIDFNKDGSLNDRSLNRIDIVKKIQNFANKACFGERTEEFTQRQNQAKATQREIVDMRDKKRFKMVIPNNPETVLSELNSLKSALNKTLGVFTRDSNQFKLVLGDISSAIKSVERARQLKPDISVDELKQHMECALTSTKEYIMAREAQNKAMLAQGKKPNERTLKRMEIANAFAKFGENLGMQGAVTPRDRIATRVSNYLLEQEYKKNPRGEVKKNLDKLALNPTQAIENLVNDKAFRLMKNQMYRYQIEQLARDPNGIANVAKKLETTKKDMKDVAKLDKMERECYKVEKISSYMSQYHYGPDQIPVAEAKWKEKEPDCKILNAPEAELKDLESKKQNFQEQKYNELHTAAQAKVDERNQKLGKNVEMVMN